MCMHSRLGEEGSVWRSCWTCERYFFERSPRSASDEFTEVFVGPTMSTTNLTPVLQWMEEGGLFRVPVYQLQTHDDNNCSRLFSRASVIHGEPARSEIFIGADFAICPTGFVV
jgi:hypothetical protein